MGTTETIETTPIREAAIEWLNAYNDTCASGKDMLPDGPRAGCGWEFIRRCERAALNPLEEDVTAYPAYNDKTGVWSLVWIPALQTLLRRAESTGLLMGIRRSSRVREDRVVIVWAEVVRLYVPSPGAQALGVTPEAREFYVEGRVDQWQAQVGRSPFWKANPEHMAGNAVLRAALMEAFPDVLDGFGEDAPDASEVTEVPAPAAGIPPVSDRATPAEANVAARSVLDQARQRAKDRTAASAAPAAPSAPVTPPPASAPAAPAAPAARPVAGPAAAQAAPASTELDAKVAAAGLTPADADDLCLRWKGVVLADLSPADLATFQGRVLPRCPATKAQVQELQRLHAAWMSLDPQGGAKTWNALCHQASGSGMDWMEACVYVTQREALAIIELAEPAIREAA